MGNGCNKPIISSMLKSLESLEDLARNILISFLLEKLTVCAVTKLLRYLIYPSHNDLKVIDDQSIQ